MIQIDKRKARIRAVDWLKGLFLPKWHETEPPTQEIKPESILPPEEEKPEETQKDEGPKVLPANGIRMILLNSKMERFVEVNVVTPKRPEVILFNNIAFVKHKSEGKWGPIYYREVIGLVLNAQPQVQSPPPGLIRP